MNFCSRHHDEICYEGHDCPMCVIIKEKDDKISELEDKISELEERVENQYSEIKELIASNEAISEEVEQSRKDLALTRDGQRDGQR